MAPGICAALLALALALAAASPAPAAESALEIMRAQRDLHRLRDEQETITMRIVSRTGGVKERRIARHVLTDARNLSKILLRFLAPRDVQNTGLLTWEAADGDDDQWLYLPAARTVRRIAAGSKKSRFMGTHFAFEDLRPESLPLHRYTLVGPEACDGRECWVIDAVPASDRQAADSGYGRRRLWVRRDNHVTVRQEYHDRQGALEKVATARKLINVVGTVWRPDEVEMRDARDGSRTLLIVERRVVNSGLPESFFTEIELTRDQP
jgi:hypothetical protein